MATRRPRLKKGFRVQTPGKRFATQHRSGFGGPTKGVVTPKAPGMNTTAPTAPIPKYGQVPKPMATPPPSASLQTTLDRNVTRQQYGTGMGDTNFAIRNLAAGYGLAPSVVQYGYDPGSNADTQTQLSIAQNQPGSTAEVLARNLALQHGNIDDNAELSNTFFSGRRLNELTSADDQYRGDLAQAQRDYEQALATLTGGLLSAQTTRNTNLSQADINDATAAVQAPPEAQAPQQTPLQFLQGLGGTLTNLGGKWYLRKPDGSLVPV